MENNDIAEACAFKNPSISETALPKDATGSLRFIIKEESVYERIDVFVTGSIRGIDFIWLNLRRDFIKRVRWYIVIRCVNRVRKRNKRGGW